MLHRRLGYWEIACALGEQYLAGSGMVFQVMGFRGTLCKQRCVEALLQLQACHPLLQMSLVPQETVHCFQNADYEEATEQQRRQQLPLFFHVRADHQHWQRFSQQCSYEMAEDNPYLWRAHLLVDDLDEECHELILVMDHAISDGISTAQLAYQWLSLLAGETQSSVCQLYAAPEQMIARPAEPPLPASASTSPLEIPFQGYAPMAARDTHLLWRVLDVDTTAHLLALCKSNGTKLNGLLSALLAKVALGLVGSPPGTHSLNGLVAVNLRTSCSPAVDKDVFGCFVTIVCPPFSLSNETPLWELAQRGQASIVDVFTKAAATGFLPQEFEEKDILANILSAHETTEAKKVFFAPVAISNIGALSYPEHIGSYQLKEMFFWTRQVAGSFLLPITVLSLHGKLHCCFGYTYPLLSHETAGSLVDEVWRQLKAL